jgi:pimeloyl-ACP methyl ester carboxylesterase
VIDTLYLLRTSRGRFVVWMLAAAALGAANCTAVPAIESKPHACLIPGSADQVQCATYSVWENRELRSGRRIGLKIVILPALGPQRRPDPIFMLHGGPGAAATDLAPAFIRFRALRARRDIVFVDQRGTGGSNPLACDFYGDPPDLQKVVSSLFPVDAIRACRERLSKIADLGMYTTTIGMDDLDDVRRWLGYEKINVWGGSYGTIAAQVYLRRHEASVRTVVLGAVAPVDELIPLHHAWAGQRAVNILFDRCRADAACNEAYPHLREDFRSIFERVRQGVEVQVSDGKGGSVRVRPSTSMFAEGIRHSLYYDDGRSFPAMIRRAAAGDLAPLIESAITANLNLNRILSMGMNLSVSCAEGIPYIDAKGIPYIDDATLARETAGTFVGDLRVQEQRAACREWVRGAIPRDFHQLVRSPVPVLLLSGERDSVTPPPFAERVAKQLPNSLHVVFPEASHGNWGACGNRIWADFIERGSVQDLDVSCATGQPPTKFLIEP